jgi:hypothetical protein
LEKFSKINLFKSISSSKLISNALAIVSKVVNNRPLSFSPASILGCKRYLQYQQTPGCNSIRRLLLEYMEKQVSTGFPPHFDNLLWSLSDLFDLLDEAAAHLQEPRAEKKS